MMSLEELEKSLKIRLPVCYKHLLTHYPHELYACNYFGDPEQGGPRNFELISNFDDILKLNRRERNRWSKGEYATVPLLATYVFIGHDGSGDLFAIDAAELESCPVWKFDHENGHWQKQFASIDKFCQYLLVFAKKLNSNARRNANNARE
jgi:hypothetical protein